jgi:hypothetical protein
VTGIDIEQGLTELVRQAPDLDRELVDDVVRELRGIERADARPLAQAIARVVELVAKRHVDPGIALPALAMACATLTGGLAGTLGPRELEAARYEIETLLPLPDRGAGARVVMPDVSVDQLRRRKQT